MALAAKPIGQILKDMDLITELDIQEALQEQKSKVQSDRNQSGRGEARDRPRFLSNPSSHDAPGSQYHPGW